LGGEVSHSVVVTEGYGIVSSDKDRESWYFSSVDVTLEVPQQPINLRTMKASFFE
jgi:hypothetical protein